MAQIASMTGFARAAGTTGPVHWAWEVRSVNGRGLDVRIRVPTGYDGLGETARTALQKTLSRGQCQLTLTLTKPEAAARVRINEALLASLAQAVARVPVPEGVAPATLDGLLGVRGVIEVEDEAAETRGPRPRPRRGRGPAGRRPRRGPPRRRAAAANRSSPARSTGSPR